MQNQYKHVMVKTDPKIASISFINHKSLDGDAMPEEVLSLLV